MTSTASDTTPVVETRPPDVAPDTEREVAVYVPTKVSLRGARQYLGELWNRRPLIWHLTRTDLKGENYDTVLGQVWLILNPLFLALTYLFIRGVIRPMGTPEERNDLIAHLIVGVFFFHFTSDTVIPGARAIVGGRQLVLNTEVPRGVFPVQKFLRGVLDFAPMLLVIFLIQAALGQPFSLAMLWIPAFVAVQAVFNLGLVLVFCTLAVFFRDTLNILRYITRVWLFTTPVLYTIDEIPERMRPILALNPLFPFFAAYEAIFDGEMPDVASLLPWASAWAFGALVVGTVLFLVRERDFAPRL